jgi:hypothetical protein
MHLCLTRSQVELTAVELCRTRGHAVRLPSDLVACESFTCECFCLARGDKDFSRLEIREAAETVALDGQGPLDPLLLRAQLVLARRERNLAFLNLR